MSLFITSDLKQSLLAIVTNCLSLLLSIGVGTADGPSRRLGTAVLQVRRAALQRAHLQDRRRLLRLHSLQRQGLQDQSFIQVRSKSFWA